MSFSYQVPPGEGVLGLLLFGKYPNAYSYPIISGASPLAYRIGSDDFVLFDSIAELLDFCSDDDIPQSICCNPDGYARLMAAYYNHCRGRVLLGKNSFCHEFIEEVIDLEANKPTIVDEELVFLTLEMVAPYPKVHRNRLSLQSLTCESEFLIDSNKEYYNITIE